MRAKGEGHQSLLVVLVLVVVAVVILAAAEVVVLVVITERVEGDLVLSVYLEACP